MKRKLFSLGLLSLLTVGATAQIIIDTVSVGPNYANQKWYSLQNDEQGTQSKDNWDLAFEITGISSAVLANTQKANFAVYHAPFEISDYGILDTAGISTWPVAYNSDTTWTIGALNKGADSSNPFDMGWGNYDMNTHFVTGDSCFVIKLSATSYKKLRIISLASGIYTFEYANINGTNSFTQTIAKSSYTGKNFAYADLTANTVLNREPASSAWDLTFGRYTAILMAPTPTPYSVVGIMHNKGVTVAQANNVASPSTYTAWSGHSQNTNITTIGHDWKAFDLNSNAWKIENDSVYFVKDKNDAIWKVRPIAFGGASDGNFIFSKEKLKESATVGVADHAKKGSTISVYPNPTDGTHTNLLFSSDKAQTVSVSVVDMTGRTLSLVSVETSEGLTLHPLNTSELPTGVYFVKLNAGSYSAIQKLIVR